MDETLRSSKQVIRQYIKPWSDEKLAQVYAFNQDGHMLWANPCSCLIGVGSSNTLPVICAAPRHFIGEHERNPDVSSSYLDLGYFRTADCAPTLRLIRLSAILRAEMRLRSYAKQQANTEALCCVV